MRLGGICLAGIGATLGMVQYAAAEAELETSVSGSVRGAYFQSSRDLDTVEKIGSTALWLKAKSALASNVSASVEGWTQRNEASAWHKGQSQVREAYLDFSAESWDARLGKQIIAWGRADKLNPTDNLTPRDYTLLFADDEEQRLGALAAVFNYHVPGNGLVLTGIWMPRIQPNTVPIRRSPGIVFSESIPDTQQYAIKLDHSGGEVDWSLSYLDGASLNPEFRKGAVSSSGMDVAMQYKRVRVLGVDAASVVGRYGFRAEAAYTWTEVDNRLNNGFTGKPFLYAVLGGDRTFDNGLNVNLQYFMYRVLRYVDPRNIVDPLARSVGVENAVATHQLDPHTQGFSFRVSKKWLNDTLEGEIATVIALGTADFALKPRLTYAVDDQLKVSVGVDLFRGKENTFFGRLKDTSTVFAELKYSF